MRLIVGMGNPGAEYAGTRHNVGFEVVELLGRRHGIPLRKRSMRSVMGDGLIEGHKVILARPTTYMNLSGDAVRLLVNAYVESTDDLMVVYDDIDLPLGKLRIRPSGSSGTHNGMRSIVQTLETERFPRLRVGIGSSDGGPLRDYVLDEFAPDEQTAVDRAIERAVDALVLFCRGDLKRAMNEFNRDETP